MVSESNNHKYTTAVADFSQNHNYLCKCKYNNILYIRQNVIISEHHQSDTYINKLGQDTTHTHTFIKELMLLDIFFPVS